MLSKSAPFQMNHSIPLIPDFFGFMTEGKNWGFSPKNWIHIGTSDDAPILYIEYRYNINRYLNLQR